MTWVEHVEIDDRAVHSIYKPLVNSGLAFGAKRWVATLDRQCERLASVMANNISAGDVGGTIPPFLTYLQQLIIEVILIMHVLQLFHRLKVERAC